MATLRLLPAAACRPLKIAARAHNISRDAAGGLPAQDIGSVLCADSFGRQPLSHREATESGNVPEIQEEESLPRIRSIKKRDDARAYGATTNAFRSVLRAYRFARYECSPIQATNYAANGKSETKLSESKILLIADVDLAIRAALPATVHPYFVTIYCSDIDDEIEMEKLASRLLHGGQHRASSLKHRVGSELIRRGIAPLSNYLKFTRGRCA